MMKVVETPEQLSVIGFKLYTAYMENSKYISARLYI